jgi:FkbM family methyltransferase
MLEIVKRAHDDIAHQGHRVLEAVHEGQVDVKQQGQQMLEIVQRAHDAIAHQGQRLWEAVHEGQIDAKRREESLLDTVQQTRSDVEQQTQSLRETVQGAQEETRQQILEAVKVLQESAGIPGRLLATDASPHRPQLMVGQDGPLDPEAALMTHLYSYLTNRNALDIGANVGHMSSCLLDAGYEVYAFEPYLPVYRELSERLGGRPAFHSFPTAVGPADDTRDLHIASDQSGTNMYRDPTLFSSLTRHAMPDDLVFTEAISVPVRSLQSLHASGDIPARVGLVKIDTEGFDLEVIRGMGACRYDVVVAEYWDAANPFAVSGAMNRLDALVAEMRSRDYHWHIVFHTTWGEKSVGFYCNYPHSLPRTWGNVFFFRDHELFRPALAWCTAVLPPTYVTGSVCR